MKKILKQMGILFAKLILSISSNSANQACTFYHHQPELPDEVKKLRKF